MGRTFKILTLCGAGVATCHIIKVSLEHELEKRGIDAEVTTGRIYLLPPPKNTYDLLVSGNPIPEDLRGGLPLVTSLSFFIGTGLDETVDKIVEVLNSIK